MSLPTCPNGHEIDSAFQFCPTCGVATEVTVPAPATDSTSPDGTAHNRVHAFDAEPTGVPLNSGELISTTKWPRQTVAALVAIAVAVIGLSGWAIASSSGDTADAATTASDRPTPRAAPEPLTRAEKCVARVMDYLWQFPDAMRDGYNMGVSAEYLMTEYGSSSPEYNAAIAAQVEMVRRVTMYGNPERQVNRLHQQVQEDCESGGYY